MKYKKIVCVSGAVVLGGALLGSSLISEESKEHRKLLGSTSSQVEKENLTKESLGKENFEVASAESNHKIDPKKGELKTTSRIVEAANTSAKSYALKNVGGVSEGRVVLEEMKSAFEAASEPNLIALKNVQFNISPDYIPDLTGEDRHVYVQFSSSLNAEKREFLARNGVRLDHYISANTWSVKLSSNSARVLREMDEVHGFAEVMPIDKVSPGLAKAIVPPHAKLPNGVALVGELHKNSSTKNVQEQLLGLNASDIQLEGNRILFTLELGRLEQAASIDEITYLSTIEPPKGLSNVEAATLSGVTHVLENTTLRGNGVTIGEWDAGAVDLNHQDFGDGLGGTRVQIPPNLAACNTDVNECNNHATHVAGTIIGNGEGNANARGMAPLANLLSRDWNNVNAELNADATANLIDIATHSWGWLLGWNFDPENPGCIQGWADQNCWTNTGNFDMFGDYRGVSRDWDNIVNNNPELVMTVAVGNDRNDIPPNPPVGEPAFDGPFDTIDPHALTKNVIGVGAAVNDGDETTNFSNWGPVDDGRIKPDLIADGTGVFSTLPGDNYASWNGTSMATPVVAGGLALVIEHWREEFPTIPVQSSMIKALAIHSADDVVNANATPAITAGPDYQTGWGLLNIQDAVGLISEGTDHFMTVTFADGTNAGEEQEFTFAVGPGETELKITAAWTEAGANIMAGLALINDVDVRLVSPDNVVHNPWVLNPGVPANAATRGDNNVDNVEQVVVANPAAGIWTLRLEAGGNFVGAQNVSVVSSISLEQRDSDGDLLTDNDEARFGTDPNNADPDNDTLTDLEEVCFDGNCADYSPYPQGRDTNANAFDTDNDGLGDGEEIAVNRNPVLNEPALIVVISSLLYW